VCEKNPDPRFDFDHDPIDAQVEGDWVSARGTTLGADNGVGLAAALAVVTDESAVHGPLELLFTVDEETGLTGAAALAPGFFSGRLLINLDSEDEGVFTIGCAGGRDSELLLKLAYAPWPTGHRCYELAVAGLQGGHSGVDIIEGRGNANVLLARTLVELGRGGVFNLAGLHGGSAHNAIPREAVAQLAIPATTAAGLVSQVAEWAASLRRSYANEPKLNITLTPKEGGLEKIISPEMAGKILDLLLASPDGVMAMSREFPGLVESSVNLATIREKKGRLSILISQRSDKPLGLNWLTAKLAGLARLAGAEIVTGCGYPGWPPEPDSPLLLRAQRVYREMFDQEASIESIHAGLECGIIGANHPGLDMLSLGPTLKNPHSPDERLHLPSLERFCPFIRALIASFAARS